MSGRTSIHGGLVLCFLLLGPAMPQEQSRPSRHPQFSEGFRAFNYKNWRQAADLMREAQNQWAEDGERTRVYGRRFETYLPRYYLGVSLYELGCYKEALDHLERSLLNHEQIQGTRDELDTLRSLKQKCEEYLRLGIERKGEEDCSRWSLTVDDVPND